MSYAEIKAKLTKILAASDTLFEKVKPPIIVTGKRLLDGEETESFELVEDESLGQKLVEIFNTKIADEEKEEE